MKDFFITKTKIFQTVRIQSKLVYKIILTLLLKNESHLPSTPSSKIDIQNHSVSYLKSGKGKPIIFLHGWGQSKETWKNIIPYIKKSNTAYLIDLPNFGESSISLKTMGLDDYVDIVYEFIKKMKIKKCILVGHSFGGKVALGLSAKHAEKIEKTILYSTNLNTSKSFYRNIVHKIIKNTFNIYFLLFKKHLLSTWKIRFSILENTDLPINYITTLAKSNSKIMFFYGAYDFIASPHNAGRFEELFYRHTGILFKKSSHLAHLEERDKFIKELLRFI